MGDKIRVLFVDDDPKLRRLWTRVLEQQDDMTVVTALATADDLPAHVPDGPAVVLLDLTMPGRHPLDALTEINQNNPDCRVILYSGHSDPDTIRKALEAGAWGMVDKTTPPEEVLQAIRTVARGDAVFPETFAG